MGKGQNDEYLKILASSLSDFSKHLMVILVAIIAFASAPALKDTEAYIQHVYIAGVVMALISFGFGHKGILQIINSYLRENTQGDLINNLNIGTIRRMKRFIELQYWFSAAAILLISISIVLSVITDKVVPNKNAQDSSKNSLIESTKGKMDSSIIKIQK